MKLIALILLILPLLSHAIVSQSEYESIIIKSIYKEMYKRVKKIPQEELKTEKKESIKPKSRGSLIIEQMKAKNRAKIARMRGLDPSKISSGADLVNGQKKANKKFIKKISKIRKEQEKLKNRSLSSNEWNRLYNKLHAEWEKEKRDFIKNLPKYKKAQFNIPVVKPVNRKAMTKKTEIKIEEEHLFVSNALEVPIRNQKYRPTCSAFAGIRAIEINLKQKQQSRDLSEQFFYWASKPDCRNKRCTNRGSWVGYGLDYLKSPQKKVPRESQCPYKSSSIKSNETQIPLLSGCNNGQVSIQGYSYLKTLDEMITQIKKNNPVIISMKLTPNFYKNKGLVLYSEKNRGQSMMDNHATGHSAIIVGMVKLSPYLKEGKYCFILANSWGTGWGQGGYSCLSEKWVLKQRGRNPMVVVH